MCQKIPYLTKADAKADVTYLDNLRRRFSKNFAKSRKSGRKLKPYWCRYCGFWHLTTRKK